MANRILKESICVSDSIDRLSWFEEVVFYRLIVNCDDYGRFDGRIVVIKNRLFPLRERIDTDELRRALEHLEALGMLVRYQADGKPYLYLTAWRSHQKIRTKRSKYPAPAGMSDGDGLTQSETACGSLQQLETECVPNPIQSESNPNPNPNSNPNSSPANTKAKYGEFGWILLSGEEHRALLQELGEKELLRCITYIDQLAQQSGNKYHWKDWALVLRRASREGWGVRNPDSRQTAQKKDTSYNLDEIDQLLTQQYTTGG